MNDVFKALADPTRRKILELLASSDKNAGEIADYFQITKPSISHHLSILKSAELIIDHRKGQNIVYSLNTTVFQDMVKWFFDVTKRTDDKKENEIEDETEDEIEDKIEAKIEDEIEEDNSVSSS